MSLQPEARVTLEQAEDGPVMRLSGHWGLADLMRIEAELDGLRLTAAPTLRIDGHHLGRIDTSGAMLLWQRLHAWGVAPANLHWSGFTPRQQALLELVQDKLASTDAGPAVQESWLHRLGRQGADYAAAAGDMLAFIGQLGIAAFDWLRHPGRIRLRELFVQFEAVGVASLPIVALMTFLIGVVFTYLLGIQVEKYGANIFIVDGVSLAVTRELGPLLTALLVAGRSGAAFTAQIGAMKVTEEIDAIRTLGLSPIQVLVLPRLLAIVISLPLLTFAADVAGILGAALVSAQQLDITPYTFFARLQDVLPLYTVGLGLAKAPVFAVAIAIIACHNGFSVTRDARSVGLHTTTTVVRSLVAVILIDALFSIAFPKITP
jgi:phospholipid/cholesterol/gamma-HCH transport system permease protein